MSDKLSMNLYNKEESIAACGVNERPLNVVFIADLPVTGGATNSLIELTSALHELYGVNCTVCTHQKSKLNDRLDANGIKSVVTGHGPFLAGGSQFKLKALYSVVVNFWRWRKAINSSICSAEKEIDFSKVDLIHSNLPRNDLGILLAAKYDIPHICHFRESSFEDFDCISLRRSPAKYISDNSAAMIAVSNYVKSNWVNRGADPDKVQVIYNGVDTAGIKRRDSPTVNRPLKAIFLGGYTDAKGIRDVLEAAAELPKNVSSAIQIDIFGYGNRSRAKSFVKRHKLEQFVHLNGALENVKESLAAYDIGLACSRAEAFGRIILEYRAAGLTIVAANRGAFPELINNGIDGFLYDSGGHGDGLASVLTKISNGVTLPDYGKAVAMRTRGPKEVAAEVYALYKRILDAE